MSRVRRSVNILFSDGNMFDETGFTSNRMPFECEDVAVGNIISVSGVVLLGSMGMGIAHLEIETTSNRLTVN